LRNNLRKEFKRMDIIEKTHELGKMIEESEEMKAMKAAEEIQSNDEAAVDLIQQYNLARMNIARDMHEGKIDQDEAVKRSEDAYNKLLENEKIKNYVDAKEKFNDFIQKINDVLTYYITGKEPGCTHDCCSCGGCH